MKKFELNEIGRVVLIILIWLLSFTVVTNVATVTGTAFIGAFTFYVGALFLSFGYFKDEKLMKNAKLSLIVVAIFAIVYMALQCYPEILQAFNVAQQKNGKITVPWRIADVVNGVFIIFKNVVMVICLGVAVINALRTGDNKIIDLDEKENNAKVETKEENKE